MINHRRQTPNLDLGQRGCAIGRREHVRFGHQRAAARLFAGTAGQVYQVRVCAGVEGLVRFGRLFLQWVLRRLTHRLFVLENLNHGRRPVNRVLHHRVLRHRVLDPVDALVDKQESALHERVSALGRQGARRGFLAVPVAEDAVLPVGVAQQRIAVVARLLRSGVPSDHHRAHKIGPGVPDDVHQAGTAIRVQHKT